MQTTKYNFSKPVFILLLNVIYFYNSNAQNLDKPATKKIIESKNFIFKAQTVLSLSGTMKQLTTTDYDVRIFGDSLITYLPYFGRAYTSIDLNESGFNFTSTRFTYQVKEKKKGGWNITISPKDTKDVRQMLLDVSENGNAYLNVSSNSRQSISYNGYITQRK